VILSNYHTHTAFCDGSSEPEQYVIEALEKKFFAFGFSAHAPLYFDNPWSLVRANVEKYCKTIQQLKEKYAEQIEIYLSMEMDFIPGFTDSFEKVKLTNNLDYVLGAVHLVKNPMGENLWFIDGPKTNYDKGLTEIFGNDIQFAVSTYFSQLHQMLDIESFDIIAHFDKVKMNNKDRYFNENDKWYVDLVDNALEKIAEKKVIVEVNTRGIYTGRYHSWYPGIRELQKCLELKIPITISADAHKPHELNGYFTETEVFLKKLGYKSMKVFKQNQWQDFEI
jgi:histidinol-phosphatase (PHP family)